MIYLLGQILLCILLAAIAGWFIGWSWRGFREQGRVEDIRRTLRATEEVKDRDLSESQRREDALRSRVETLERRCERLADELSATRRDGEGPAGSPRQTEGSAVAESAGEGAQGGVSTLVQDDALPALEAEVRRLETGLERELERRQEAEEALREKTGAMLSLQAELSGLRSGAEERAAEVARLQRRIVELEPLEERLARRESELRDLDASLREASRERSSCEERARDLDRRSAALEEQLRDRDRRVNELRNDYQDVVARLESLEAERDRLAEDVRYGGPAYADVHELRERLQECSRRLREADGRLDDAHAALQRQIERNRKQEVIHQRVVANLQDELHELRTRAAAPRARPAEASGAEAARQRRLLAQQDSGISDLRGRLRALEERLASIGTETDDLTKIHGIGPRLADVLHSLGITRFAQIASWKDADIARIGARLGLFEQRIRRDGWVQEARRQYRLKYGRDLGDAVD